MNYFNGFYTNVYVEDSDYYSNRKILKFKPPTPDYVYDNLKIYDNFMYVDYVFFDWLCDVGQTLHFMDKNIRDKITCLHFSYIDRGITDFEFVNDFIIKYLPNLDTLEIHQNFSYSGEYGSDENTKNAFLNFLKKNNFKRFWMEDKQSHFFILLTNDEIFQVMPENSHYIFHHDDEDDFYWINNEKHKLTNQTLGTKRIQILRKSEFV